MPRRTPRSDDPDIASLKQRLQDLSLTVMARDLEVVLQEAEKEQLGHCDFIDRLLQREHGIRWERKIERRLKRARLGEVKSLEEFDFTIRPKLRAPAVKELLRCRFIEEGRIDRVPGKARDRKDARRQGHRACRVHEGVSVYTGVTVDILDELEASLADGTFPRVFKRLATADLLVWDEHGDSIPGTRQRSRKSYS